MSGWYIVASQDGSERKKLEEQHVEELAECHHVTTWHTRDERLLSRDWKHIPVDWGYTRDQKFGGGSVMQ